MKGSTLDRYGDNRFDDRKDSSYSTKDLTICDKNGNCWKILFG